MSIRSVNRYALIVTRRKPYADWANRFDDDGPRFDLEDQSPTVYLITEPEGPMDVDRVLTRQWRPIFEEELSAWMRDPEVWPRRRTFRLFREWFEVACADLALDLSRGYLEAEP